MRPLGFAALAALACIGGLFLWLELTTSSGPEVTLPGSKVQPESKEPDAADEHREPIENASVVELLEDGPDGKLPRIGLSGRMPWQVYRAKHEAGSGGPIIAVVVTNLGLDAAASASAIDTLPAVVTLVLSPYAEQLPRWASRARKEGHEIMVAAPMEPIDYPSSDPGDKGLLTSLSATENMARLHWIMGRFTGYVGVAGHMGSRFATSTRAMRPVLSEIKARGLAYLDNGSAAGSVATSIAGEINLPHAGVSDRIDIDLSPGIIDTRLANLEEIARRNGAAVALGFPYPVTIDRVGEWIVTLRGKGIDAVPLTALIEAGSR